MTKWPRNIWSPALVAGCALFSLSFAAGLSSSAAVARDCTCQSVGGMVCIPDPGCINDLIKDKIDLAIDRLRQDSGRTTKEVVQELRDSIKTDTSTSSPKLIILETGYSQLAELGKEESGYGLYSYVILAANSDRSSALLSEIFKSIPRVQDTAAQRPQVNILYIPIKSAKTNDFANSVMVLGNDPKKLGAEYAKSMYDYQMARGLINHVCNPPADVMKEFCAGDTSRGPYLFAYGRPASTLEPVPPPFLFLDLSDIHPNAFGEFISAFRAQVKREDISDGARINTLRLKVLDIALKAADWIPPIQRAIAEIVKSKGDSSSGGK